jgi:hypothetical protein
LGRLTFLLFGIDVQESNNMRVRKYKNCIHYGLVDKRSILWYFDGKFYFGGWKKNDFGDGEKYGRGFELIPNRYIYDGEFKFDKRNGFGRMKLFINEKSIVY